MSPTTLPVPPASPGTGVASAALVARTQASERIVRGAPVGVSAIFYQPRLRGHYGTGRNAHVLKIGAPAFPARKPDVDKFLRRILDALTGVIYEDDGQVVEVHGAKRWGDPARAEIRVWVVGAVAEDGQLALDQLALAVASRTSAQEKTGPGLAAGAGHPGLVAFTHRAYGPCPGMCRVTVQVCCWACFAAVARRRHRRSCCQPHARHLAR